MIQLLLFHEASKNYKNHIFRSLLCPFSVALGLPLTFRRLEVIYAPSAAGATLCSPARKRWECMVDIDEPREGRHYSNTNSGSKSKSARSLKLPVAPIAYLGIAMGVEDMPADQESQRTAYQNV